MELRRLRYFVAVAEELHFRRAAERLHLAQPALSQQVRKLEVELGVQLLHRSKRSVALTPPGAIFLEEARRVLRLADEAARAARAARDGAGGRLRIGHLADAVPTVLARSIAAFAARHPEVEVRPEIAPARRAVEDVRAGRLDVAVVGLPLPADGLRVTAAGSERVVAAVSARDALSGLVSIPLSRLAETPLVLLPRPVNPAFYDGVLGACRTAGIAPPIVETAEPKLELALLSVVGGAGAALLPASAAEQYTIPGVVFRPLEAPASATEIAFVTRTEPTSITVAAFLRAAASLPAQRSVAAVPAALAA